MTLGIDSHRMSSSRILLFLLLLIGISGEILQHRLLAASPKEIFTDITQEAEITWQQFGGESPDRFLIETMGGGVAFVDFDNDGRLVSRLPFNQPHDP